MTPRANGTAFAQIFGVTTGLSMPLSPKRSGSDVDVEQRVPRLKRAASSVVFVSSSAGVGALMALPDHEGRKVVSGGVIRPRPSRWCAGVSLPVATRREPDAGRSHANQASS
jgi:hypothetical protein